MITPEPVLEEPVAHVDRHDGLLHGTHHPRDHRPRFIAALAGVGRQRDRLAAGRIVVTGEERAHQGTEQADGYRERRQAQQCLPRDPVAQEHLAHPSFGPGSTGSTASGRDLAGPTDGLGWPDRARVDGLGRHLDLAVAGVGIACERLQSIRTGG